MGQTFRINIEDLKASLENEKQAFDGLMLEEEGPFKEHAHDALRESLAQIRNFIVSAAKGALGPNYRGATAAILRRTYKQELGGNVNILQNKRKFGDKNPSAPQPGSLRHRTVSARTQQVRSYGGRDAGLILRFKNAGTDVRVAKGNGKGRGSRATYGARGAMSGRNFMSGGDGMLAIAGQQLMQKIIQLAETQLNNKNAG